MDTREASRNPKIRAEERVALQLGPLNWHVIQSRNAG